MSPPASNATEPHEACRKSWGALVIWGSGGVHITIMSGGRGVALGHQEWVGVLEKTIKLLAGSRLGTSIPTFA